MQEELKIKGKLSPFLSISLSRLISDNKLRSYVRNLKFFKNLKNFEKKYLRTGKSRQKREN